MVRVNVDTSLLNETASILNFKVSVLPFKYLGIPIGDNLRKLFLWYLVVDRIRVRLSSWKENGGLRAINSKDFN